MESMAEKEWLGAYGWRATALSLVGGVLRPRIRSLKLEERRASIPN